MMASGCEGEGKYDGSPMMSDYAREAAEGVELYANGVEKFTTGEFG